MSRIVIASASENSRAQLNRLLGSSGFSVFRLCASGSELRRTLNTCEDGVVIIFGTVPDCQIDDVAADFGDDFQILLIARPIILAGCESENVFRLAFPCAGSAIVGALEMLSQFHAMRMPKRGGEEKALIEQAKALLMRINGITEPEAHRHMQQYAMRRGMKMTDYAAQLLLRGQRDEQS